MEKSYSQELSFTTGNGAQTSPHHNHTQTASELGGAIEGLLLQTNATRGAFDGWVAEARSGVDSIEAFHRSAMALSKLELGSKRIQVSEAENKAGAFANVKQGHDAMMTSERSALASLENVLHALPEKSTKLSAEAASAAAEVTAMETERSTKSRDMEHQLHELTRGVVMYKFLGLEFQRAEDDRLLIRFTNLDPMDWDREFSFRVGLGSDDAYRVDGCSPQVEESKLEALLGRLNVPNEVDPMEFPGFVVEMRRAFKAMV